VLRLIASLGELGVYAGLTHRASGIQTQPTRAAANLARVAHACLRTTGQTCERRAWLSGSRIRIAAPAFPAVLCPGIRVPTRTTGGHTRLVRQSVGCKQVRKGAEGSVRRANGPLLRGAAYVSEAKGRHVGIREGRGRTSGRGGSAGRRGSAGR
jgi:hypothetical protein